MGDKTGIEWTDATWNPVSGCTKVSQGCKHCYAERDWARLSAPRTPPNIYTGRAFTDIALHPERLEEPLRWRKPRKVFVNSLSDLFHEDVPDEFIDKVFAVMALAPKHTFQVLTKRPARMRGYMQRFLDPTNPVQRLVIKWGDQGGRHWPFEKPLPKWDEINAAAVRAQAPLPNVWIGVSVENQETADERIPMLLQTPAAIRFASCEPLLGPITLLKLGLHPREHRNEYDHEGYRRVRRGLDWVIVGGESGPDARMFRVQWARSIVRQCRAVGAPVFVKQMGSYVVDRNDAGFGEDVPTAWPIRPDGCDPVIEYDIHGYRQQYQGADCRIRLMDRKGADPAEWPEDLRVREFPRAVGEEFRAALAGKVQPTEAS